MGSSGIAGPGGHGEDPVAAPRHEALGSPTLPGEPRGQRVGAQVLLHHQARGARVGAQALEPGGEQVVERGLAHPDRGVGPDLVDHEVGRHVGWCHHPDPVAHAVGVGVGPAQVAGPLVHVDRPHHGLGCPQREGDRDGAVAAAHVGKDGGIGDRGALHEQDPRPRIDLGGGEDPGVGGELDQAPLWQDQLDLARCRRPRGSGREVVVAIIGLGSGHRGDGSLALMAPYEIRVIGDPVLKQRAVDVTDIDGRLARLVTDMIDTMYDAPGLGLAAPQIGVQQRLFVWDVNDGTGAHAIVNPEIVESSGEWSYQEGCLSVPGLSWEIVRPKDVHVVGLDLQGNEVSVEATELAGRMFQHELDHLDGVLLVERLDEDQARDARRQVRELMLGFDPEPAAPRRGLSLR